MNNQYSEHIGCSIFRACGFEAQETFLGYFTDINGKNKIGVACKDFTQGGNNLHEFSQLCRPIQVETKSGTTIESVYDVITRNNKIRNKGEILEKFWDMFVIDALIGNPDRHFDNWGILEFKGDIRFAPIYDCGSSLAALIDDNKMNALLSDAVAYKNQEFNATSCYYIDGKRIFYHEIFSNPPNDLKKAILRTVSKINMNNVREIVDSTPQISDTRKTYLKQAMNLRYEQILTPALKRILSEQTMVTSET
jgi:hypothetical protein